MTPIKVAIIGSGPSGYTAALYTARAQLEPVVFTGYQTGGQLMWTTDVENYPGFVQGIAGPQLVQTMREQAERFGAQVKEESITAVDLTSRPFQLWTNLPAGKSAQDLENLEPAAYKAALTEIKAQPAAYTADAVIISTGATSIMLDVPGEKELTGRGVSTCAVCDAAFYRDRVTYVVGGGDSAMEDTLALTKFASEVHVVHRRDAFRASKIMQERVLNHPKVKIHWNSRVAEVKGEKKVEQIVLEKVGGEQETLNTDGLFIAIGHRPVTYLFDGQVQLDPHGYIVTRQSVSRLGHEMAKGFINEKDLLDFPTMTSLEGVFAAGDVVDVRYKQAITAAGQGCQAAIDVERWLEGR